MLRIALLLATTTTGQWIGDAPDMGVVCVAQLDESTGRVNPHAYSGMDSFPEFVIDAGGINRAAAGPDVTVNMALPLGKRHLISVSKSGAPYASFRFSFESRGAKKLCLWYHPRSHVWALDPVSRAPKRYCGVCARK